MYVYQEKAKMSDFECSVLEEIKDYAKSTGKDFHTYGINYWAEKYWDEYFNQYVESYDLTEYLSTEDYVYDN